MRVLNSIRYLCCAIVIWSCDPSSAPAPEEPALFRFQAGRESRWSSPENPNGEKGAGGKTNSGAKGRAYLRIDPGRSLQLLNIKDQGIIDRIWITISERNPSILRSLKIDMYWDGESKPAVSAPFGDFFGIGLGRTTSFENKFFASPEGRSFNCFIPMPFRSGARIEIVNESEKQGVEMYYDVDYSLTDNWNTNNLYFHGFWHRDTATALTEDFEILPPVTGKGRFLGTNVGVNANPWYNDSWWGEGEVKIYMDGDKNLPTLNGTGTEDYIGTGWGQQKFIQKYTGCTVADPELKQWAFYRYHVIDPIYFQTACKVTIQQIGGTWMAGAQRIQESGVPFIPVTTEDGPVLLSVYNKNKPFKLDSTRYKKGWANFYRSDDLSAMAYFYLDKPTNNLPPLQSLAFRILNLKEK